MSPSSMRPPGKVKAGSGAASGAGSSLLSGRRKPGKRGGEEKSLALEHLAATRSADLLTVHDLEGRCLFASGETLSLLGEDAEVLRGRRLQEFVAREDVARVDADLAAIRGPGVRRIQYRLEAPDGTSRWVESTVRHESDLLIANTREIESAAGGEGLEWSRLRLEARTDCLTLLQNRWGLEEVLDRELERSLRTGRVFSIALLDVDGFKKVNDSRGHRFGDQVLRRIASVIAGACRAYDVVGRWGGDEFLLILPDTGVEEAQRVADRMIATVAGESMDSGEVTGWTLSAGIADCGTSPTLGSIVDRADRALYRAKALGGNRVCTFDPDRMRASEPPHE